ncbi:MAG: hypothetical protein LAT63_17280 [Marinobacter sp.]|nr:hypothetical protein [Marinobacter sp.]
MFWNLVATLFAGLGAAGIALAIRSLSRKRAPKWMIPVFAAIGMLSYQIYNEYTWFDHKQTLLPPEAIVIATEERRIAWRPWSYLVPQVTSFTVLDTQSIRRELPQEDVAQFYLYRFERNYADVVTSQVYLLHCSRQELLPLGNDGEPKVDRLRQLSPDTPLFNQICH